MDKYVIYDKEMGEIFTGSFELYKEMIKGVKFLDPEDTKLALQLIRENNNMDDLFHSLNFYGINIFGEEYKDLRIERLETEININEVNKNMGNLIKQIKDELNAEAEELGTDPEVEKAWEEYCIEEIEKELAFKKKEEK